LGRRRSLPFVASSGDPDSTRVDRWLWAVRAVKTRGAATAACRGGHVRVNGRVAKPASPVRAGDRVEATLAGQRRVLEVVKAIDKRVGAPLVTQCVIDHSPPPLSRAELSDATAFRRDPGAGRPTKRDRRHLDRLRRR